MMQLLSWGANSFLGIKKKIFALSSSTVSLNVQRRCRSWRNLGLQGKKCVAEGLPGDPLKERVGWLPQFHIPGMRCPRECLKVEKSPPAPIKEDSGQVVCHNLEVKFPVSYPAVLPHSSRCHCEKLGHRFLVVIFNYLL
jgi:hypothetical protein